MSHLRADMDSFFRLEVSDPALYINTATYIWTSTRLTNKLSMHIHNRCCCLEVNWSGFGFFQLGITRLPTTYDGESGLRVMTYDILTRCHRNTI